MGLSDIPVKEVLVVECRCCAHFIETCKGSFVVRHVQRDEKSIHQVFELVVRAMHQLIFGSAVPFDVIEGDGVSLDSNFLE